MYIKIYIYIYWNLSVFLVGWGWGDSGIFWLRSCFFWGKISISEGTLISDPSPKDPEIHPRIHSLVIIVIKTWWTSEWIKGYFSVLAKMTFNKHWLKQLLVVHIFSVWTMENTPTTTTRSTLYAHLLHLLASRLVKKSNCVHSMNYWLNPQIKTPWFFPFQKRHMFFS